MTLYELLLFGHILGIATWVGGTIMLAFISSRIQATGDAEFRARFANIAAIAGPIIGVSAALALGTGIGMILDNDAIGLSDTWLWMSLVLFGVTVIVGAAFFGPASVKIVKALESGQIEEADRRARTFNVVARLDLLILLVIMGLMVFKPGA